MKLENLCLSSQAHFDGVAIANVDVRGDGEETGLVHGAWWGHRARNPNSVRPVFVGLEGDFCDHILLSKAAFRRVAVKPPGRRQRRPGGATAYMTPFGVSKAKCGGVGCNGN